MRQWCLLLAGGACLLPSRLAAQQDRELNQLQARATADSNDPITHYDLAMGYWNRKQWDIAKRELETAISIAPSYAEAYLALSALPQAKGEKYWKQRIKVAGEDSVRAEFATGAAHFRHAFLLNPLLDLAVLNKFDFGGPVVTVGNQIVFAPPWWVAELTRSANDFRGSRYDLAFARLQKIIQSKQFGSDESAPDPVLMFHGLAAAHMANFDAAVRDFALLTGRSFAREHERPQAQMLPLATNDYRYVMANMLFLNGQLDRAVPTFKRVLEIDVAAYVAHVQLARIYTATRHWDDAVRERQAAVDVNGEDPSLWVDLGATLLQAGRTAEAEEPLERGMSMNPRDARTPYLLGLALSQLHQGNRAREAFARFLAIAPSSYAAQITEVRGRLASDTSLVPAQ